MSRAAIIKQAKEGEISLSVAFLKKNCLNIEQGGQRILVEQDSIIGLVERLNEKLAQMEVVNKKRKKLYQ